MSKKAIVYIDGFNLYHGLKGKEWERYLWLDLPKVSAALLPSYCTLTRVRYFTSRVSSTPDDPGKANRQSAYIDVIKSLTPLVKVYEGSYQSKQSHCKHCDTKVECQSCGRRHIKPNEKKTDVNLVTALFVDAIENVCDVQVLISGDGDYENALKELRRLFPSKELIIAFPPKRKNNKLIQPDTHTSIIEMGDNEDWFAKSQFHDPFPVQIGNKRILIAKPTIWS
ncbi:MAG: NYN domain-containing protein [Anaerolineales bacterium]